MLRISKPIGFILGAFLGIYTRDNYLYPYPLRVSDLQQDYERLNSSIEERMDGLQGTIAKMDEQLQLAQGVYITKKLRIQEGQDPNSGEKTQKKG